MAFAVDPLTFVITIPQADLTWVSGTLYELDTDIFRLALKGWEDDAIGGITFLKTHNHNTEVTIVGTTYARAINIIAPYSITFEDGQYTVILKGSNNNIFDVAGGILNQNQVQVIPTNSAGLVVITEAATAITEQDKLDIADRVWDEVLTGASHNTPTSAGRRLRDISTAVIHTGTAVSATANTIVLNGDASAVDGAYDPALLAIVGGTGFGQTRLVLEYEGSTKTAVVDRNWKTTPDATSEYSVVANPGREHINEGLAQGGTTNTITLNTLASPLDDAYMGQVVFIRSGTGEDQALRVVSYNGTTKLATMCENWGITPDSTSGYVMLAGSILKGTHIANAIWEEDLSTHTTADSAGKIVYDLVKNTVNKLVPLIFGK